MARAGLKIADPLIDRCEKLDEGLIRIDGKHWNLFPAYRNEDRSRGFPDKGTHSS